MVAAEQDGLVFQESRHVKHQYSELPAPRVRTGRGGVPGGQLVAGRFSTRLGALDYTLYLPRTALRESLPLVVMLHGCNHQPDDFALTTGMNHLADAFPCFVLYPAQSSRANPSQCWNWHQPEDQRRGGEPAILAAMTRHIAQTHPVDTKRIFVAGMSAGGAMAGILGANYPELYAAVGIHSGLPFAAAHDLTSAYDAMLHGALGIHGHSTAPIAFPSRTIIFHGDRDTTVHPSNADRILAQIAAHGLSHNDSDVRVILPDPQRVPPFSHYPFTHTILRSPHGSVHVEQWLLHGAGHAWFGGNVLGGFADPRGPDASREMLRFFAGTHPAIPGCSSCSSCSDRGD